jgi:hypothetical protein
VDPAPTLPTIAATTGPYVNSVLNGTNATIQVSGVPSACGVLNCTYAWTLSCAGQPVQNFTGVAPSLVAGPGGNIDTTGVAVGGNVSCPLTLTVTDANGNSNSTTTSVTVKCASARACGLRVVVVAARPPAAACPAALLRRGSDAFSGCST